MALAGPVGVITLVVLATVVTGLGVFDRPYTGEEIFTTPRLVSHTNSGWRRHKRSVAVLPDHVTIRIKVKADDVDLWVTRSEDNTINVRHHELHDDLNDEKDFPHQNMELFSNGTTHAVLLVQRPDSDKDDVKVAGSFQHGASTFHIQPIKHSFNDTSSFLHTVWAYETAKTNDTITSPALQTWSTHRRHRRQSPQMTVENTVEIYAVVDYGDLKEYRSRYQISDEAAKALIIANLAYSVESANLRLQSFRSQIARAAVRLCLVGVTILTDAQSSSFSEANVAGGVLNDDRALADFQTFLTSSGQNFPKADHFILFTGYQLSTDPNLLAKETKVGSMCGADSVSLIRDKRGGMNGRSIAHGIGHSLGARNDEDYSDRSCRAEYTMSRLQIPLNDFNNRRNPFTFSRCSAQDIDKLMPTLACIKTVDIPAGKIGPGQRLEAEFFNPEQICLNELGQASDFCRDFYSFDVFESGCYNAICSVGIFCRVPSTSLCRATPAFERMSCGNGKWCVGSECVVDSRARTTNGDDIVAYDKINFPCDARLCSTFTENLGVMYNTNCPLTCPRGTFTCPNVFDDDLDD